MTDKTYPSQSQDRFIVRMPDGMRDRLAAEAEGNHRSMNAEVVARLQRTLDEDDARASQAMSLEEVAALAGPELSRHLGELGLLIQQVNEATERFKRETLGPLLQTPEAKSKSPAAKKTAKKT